MRAGLVWRWASVAVVAVALLGSAWAGEAFEGKLSFQVIAKQAGGQAMAMDYFVKGKLVRMEAKVPGMANYTLINPAERKMSIVMPAQKMVMEMAIPDAKPPADAKPPEIAKTDKTEKVTFNSEGTTLALVKEGEAAGAGAKSYDGEQWTVKLPNVTSELWVAKSLTMLAGFAETFKAMQQGPNAAWMKKVELPGFPYRIVTKNAEGNVVGEMTLVGIDTKAPDDALFVIPADYQKMGMPQMKAEPKEE